MTDYVIRIIHSPEEFASASADPSAAGQWVEWYDPDAMNGVGVVKLTKKHTMAQRFASYRDAFSLWREQSSVRPLRRDGKPNRPLTAYSISIEPYEETTGNDPDRAQATAADC